MQQVATLAPDIEALLADVAGNANAVDEGGFSNYQPPAGPNEQNALVYDVLVSAGTAERPNPRVFKYNAKNGVGYPAISIQTQIVSGGEHPPWEIALFQGNPVSKRVTGQLATLLGYTGEDVEGRTRAILLGAPGKMLKVAAYHTANKKNPGGDPFFNIKFMGVSDAQ